MIIQSV